MSPILQFLKIPQRTAQKMTVFHKSDFLPLFFNNHLWCKSFSVKVCVLWHVPITAAFKYRPVFCTLCFFHFWVFFFMPHLQYKIKQCKRVSQAAMIKLCLLNNLFSLVFSIHVYMISTSSSSILHIYYYFIWIFTY